MLESSSMVRKATTDLQIRGVPIELRDRLRRRAAEQGRSMSHYLVELIDTDLRRLTLDEWLEEARRMPPMPDSGFSAADAVHEGRRDDGTEG